MIDFAYLYQGICGLAHAHRAGTMAGHLGAAVAAGYFVGEDQGELPDEVFQGIEGELDRVIAGEEAFWFDAKKAGITPQELFQPLPQGEPDEESIDSIAGALHKNIDQLRQSGHNVIFASIAIRALRDHSDYATPAVVTGIRKLTEAFNNVPSGRGYYGQANGWRTGNQVELAPDENFPVYTSLPQMIRVTIDELITTAAVRKQGFGGLWHIINHAAAITELDRYGYKQVAQAALPAHHHHIRLWRSLPDVESELGAVVKSEHDFRQPRYWEGMLKRDEARLTHRVKTIYGFDCLKRWIDDESVVQKADDAFRYLMA